MSTYRSTGPRLPDHADVPGSPTIHEFGPAPQRLSSVPHAPKFIHRTNPELVGRACHEIRLRRMRDAGELGATQA